MTTLAGVIHKTKRVRFGSHRSSVGTSFPFELLNSTENMRAEHEGFDLSDQESAIETF